MKPEVADVLIGVARLDEFDGHAYSIGPMGVRVGFAFQQERALDLVLALHTKGKLSDSTSIAIVGVGLAGAMLKLALQGLGFAQARVFEAKRQPMAMQMSATHRPVHPCYNNWPMVDRFEPTTDFPFMNWYADDAGSVAERLVEKWTNYKTVLRPAEMPITVANAKLQTTTTNEEKVILSDATGNPLGEFDLVFFATGFGVERDLKASSVGGYWDEDRISIFRDRSEVGLGYVSGIGDGGLMDFIRLCCVDRRSNGYLPIEVISLLRHDKYSSLATTGEKDEFEQSWWEKRIREIEGKAAEMVPDSGPIGDPTSPFSRGAKNL